MIPARLDDAAVVLRPALDPVAHEILELRADDGVVLSAVWSAPARPRGAIVILGAMATPSRFYRPFAEYLAAAGWGVLRFDYRGVASSRQGSLRGNPATLDDWLDRDIEAALGYARRRLRGGPLVLVGHSFGGQAVGLAPSAQRVDAVVMVAAQSGWVGHWPRLRRLALSAVWRGVIPAVSGIAGYVPGWIGLGEDLPTGAARQWARWCLTPGYVTGVEPSDRLQFPRLRSPVLAWSFDDDSYAPASAVEELLSWYSAAAIEHRRVRTRERCLELGHFGFFRPTASSLWSDTVAWLEDTTSPRSGSEPRHPFSFREEGSRTATVES